jgi:hypothetical protein
MATKPATFFDGTNDYMSTGAEHTGNVDGRLFSYSVWFTKNANGTGLNILSNGSNRVQLFVNGATNKIQVRLVDAAAGLRYRRQTSTAITDTNWHHIMGGSNHTTLADEMYLDGISENDVASYSAPEAADIDFASGNHYIGHREVTGSQKWNGALSELWVDFGTYIDFSVEDNRLKFLTSDLKAVDLGASGQIPTGSSPDIFLGNPYTSFETNLGSGVDYIVTGALADAVGPEVEVIGGECQKIGLHLGVGIG